VLLLLFGYIYTFITFDKAFIISVQLIIVVLLSTLMHTLLFYLVTSSLKTMSAFSGLSTIVGTLIGFLAGIYIPIGLLPVYLQKIITLFPTTQAVVLLKNILMGDILHSMKSMLPKEAYEELVVMLGVKLQWNEQMLSPTFSYIYLISFTLILLVGVKVTNRKRAI